jgi:hypothetical protein
VVSQNGVSQARGCPVTAPRPFSRAAYHACPDRVKDDIAGQFQEIRFLLHDDRLVTALEHMSDAAMLAIEALRVDPVQLPHALGEIAVRGFDQEMIVVVHQTIGMHRPVEVGDDL